MLKTHQLDGHKVVVYRCGNGCIVEDTQLIKVPISREKHLHKKRCPHCTSDKLQKID